MAAMSTYTQQNHAAPLARSNSFFGTIKNLVTAPFTWLAGSDDEFEDAKGKRRRLPVPSEDAYMEDESFQSRAKRLRVDSPDRDTRPYLDPPKSAFAQSHRPSVQPASTALRDVTRSPRKILHLPSASNQLPRGRRTASPLPSSSHLKPQAITRTMSLDPPSHSSLSSRIRPAPTIQDLQSETKHARDSGAASRDVSMSPRHLRFRSSLTPQSSGIAFGPVVPPRRERGPDEPPPLTALMSNPTFVKPPPTAQKQGAPEPPKQLTLGTLMDSQRTARMLVRQSSILFGMGSVTDVAAPGHRWPVNKAEIALHELDVYKTPLLPTRLKGATAVPDMFLHKEKKHITLMTDDRPVKPRLGTKNKAKDKGKRREREPINGTKPYAGEGGMKKWLARRKKEEEEAKERERAEAMEDERAEEEMKRREAEAERKREEEIKAPPLPLPAPVFEPRASREGPLSSSLRVGRTRIGRNHIERPVSRRSKYSAAFEDEDEGMEEPRAAEQKALEEAAKKVPVFDLPAGFTFAKETTINHDLSNAKEPPITSLPFSLTVSASASASATPAPARALPTSDAEKADPFTAFSTSVPALPTISLIPPTPETVKVASQAPALPATIAPAFIATSTSSGVPNFFANSSVFAKPATLPASAVKESKPPEVPAPPAPKAADATPSLFGVPSQPAPAIAPPTLDSVVTSSISGEAKLPKEDEKLPAAAPSLAPPFTFGAPTKLVEPVPTATPSLPTEKPPPTEPTKPAASSTPLTFGASPPARPLAPATPTTTETKSDFAFGQPAAPAASTTTPTPVATTPGAETAKSLFGTPPPATPFSFGQRPSTAPAEEKPAVTPFSFGTTTTEKKPTSGFTFGSSATSTTAPAAPAAFSFGAAPSGTATADVSTKPFTFGPAAPARPATPPKAVEEVTMDESPARDMVVNGGSGKAPERPTLNFSFGTPSGSALFAQSPATATAPFGFGTSGATVNPFAKEEKKEIKPAVTFGGFGQAPSTGFSFSQKPPESPAATTSATAPFQFAQPSPSVVPTSPFPFGATSTSANVFGQPSTASAPSSPSTFNRPTPFTFGAPASTQPAASPFAFGAGSQPASPATGSTTLPSGTTGNAPFTFGAGASTAAIPAISFGAPSSGATSTGGSLFTMGSAPPPADGAGGRRIKGLPRRGRRP